MSRNWLMLLGLCQSHAAGIAAESTQVARDLEDGVSGDASLSYHNVDIESESDNQCPTAVQHALPFPLPNPARSSDTFDHYLHCAQVVLNTADPTSQDKAGAVITIEEHFNHCEAIVDSISSTLLPSVDPSVCSALGLTENSASTGCYSTVWETNMAANMEATWVRPMREDLQQAELVAVPIARPTMCPVYMVVMDNYLDYVAVTEPTLTDLIQEAPQVDWLQPTLTDLIEEAPQVDRLHGQAEMTSLPEGCKLSPEYYQLAMGWNHENLVVKSFRQPDRLTEAEQEYLDAWVNDPSVLAQYAIAKSCSA